MELFGLDSTLIVPVIDRIRHFARDQRERNDRENLARAALTMLAEPGDGVLGALVAQFGPVAVLERLVRRASTDEWMDALRGTGAAVDLSSEALARGLERWQPRLDARALTRSLEVAAKLGAHLLVPSDSSWPAGVDDLGAHAPLALWVRGRPAVLDQLGHSVALVGARASTRYGELVTVDLAAGLADRGFAVVSGAAYGVDGAAHRAALASDGTTVAFLAGGVDRFYPAGHDSLLSQIATVGAVVSELSCAQAPTKWRFLQRNRIIAAASQVTVVVEAGSRSGSLNTAGHAAALGRPLGAVPGPVTSPASAGCHRLLREFDATCVTNADEIAQLHPGGRDAQCVSRGIDAVPSEMSRSVDVTREEMRIVDGLSKRVPRTVAELVRLTGVEPAGVRAALGRLALNGIVHDRDGGWLLRGRPAQR